MVQIYQTTSDPTNKNSLIFKNINQRDGGDYLSVEYIDSEGQIQQKIIEVRFKQNNLPEENGNRSVSRYGTGAEEALSVEVEQGLLSQEEQGAKEIAKEGSYLTKEGGIVRVAKNGSFTYIPPTDFVGQDELKYQVVNENGELEERVIEFKVGTKLEEKTIHDRISEELGEEQERAGVCRS